MRIAFSTLGCPDWTWDDMLATARDLGFDGIEIRGTDTELYVPKAMKFADINIQALQDRLKQLGLSIPVLTTSCYLFDKLKSQDYIKEGRNYVDLASRLGVPYIRVLGDGTISPGIEIDLDLVAENLRVLADYAEDRKVSVLIETNGILANSDNMSYVINKAGLTNTGVLWDIHHPFRFFGEPVEKTFDKLKKYIKYIHLKDSIIENGNVSYKMTGHGDVPVEKALRLLKENNYEGFVSLEWVKRWCMELEEPGVVFSQFANFAKDIID